MLNYEKPSLEVVKFADKDMVLTDGLPTLPEAPNTSIEDDWWSTQNALNEQDGNNTN
ncbi:MAG: hypothetical protein IJO62_03945 [Clostridia bacterium]|nr:hypothetical protein [Clostridia bacterium]